MQTAEKAHFLIYEILSHEPEKHLPACPMSSLTHPALLVPSGLLIYCENSPSRGFLAGDYISARVRWAPGKWIRVAQADCSPQLTVLLMFGVILPLGLAVMQPGGCGPHIPRLSGSHCAILTVNSSFKFDAQMSSLRQHKDAYFPCCFGAVFLCAFVAGQLFFFFFFDCAAQLGRSQFPNRGLNMCPSCSGSPSPNTGPPGKSLALVITHIPPVLTSWSTMDYSAAYTYLTWLSTALCSQLRSDSLVLSVWRASFFTLKHNLIWGSSYPNK